MKLQRKWTLFVAVFALAMVVKQILSGQADASDPMAYRLGALSFPLIFVFFSFWPAKKKKEDASQDAE